MTGDDMPDPREWAKRFAETTGDAELDRDLATLNEMRHPASAPAKVEGATISIEVHQHDFIPGWAAYRDDGEFNPDSRAHVVLNIGALMACLEAKDAKLEDLPYMVAEACLNFQDGDSA